MLSRLRSPRLPLVSRAILVSFACLALVGASVLPSTRVANAAGTTHWVNDDAPQGYQPPPGKGCNKPGYSDINEAIQNSVPGDTIKVCAGTYENSTHDPYVPGETILIDRDVTVIGQGNRENVILRNDADAVVLINASGATLKNVLVRDDCGGSTDHGILVEGGVGNVSIQNNHVTSGCGPIGADVGIEINQNSSALVDGNLVDNYLEVGILVTNNSFATISNNTAMGMAGLNGLGPLSENPQVGIAILVSDATISGNTAVGHLLDSTPDFGNGLPSIGIALQGSDEVVVRNNTARFNNVGIGLQSSDDNLIDSNIASDNVVSNAPLDLDREGIGIGVLDSRDNLISNNRASFNDRQGIFLMGEVANELASTALSTTVNNTVQSNTVLFNGTSWIELVGADGNIILNNTANDNGTLGSSNGLRVTGGDGNSIRGNIANRNGASGILLQPLTDPSDGTPLAAANGNQIANNKFSQNGDHGIDLLSASGNSITNNQIDKNVDDGIQLRSSTYGPADQLVESNDNTIGSNTVKANGDRGIALREGSNRNVVQDNKVSKNGAGDDGEHGIAIFSCAGCGAGVFSNENQILRNTSDQNSGDGLFGGIDTVDNLFKDNKASGNGEHDCHDDSGVFGDPDNEWETNQGFTQNRPALCLKKNGSDAAVTLPTFEEEEDI